MQKWFKEIIFIQYFKENKCLNFKLIYNLDKNKDNFSIALFIDASELAHENRKYPSPNSPNEVPAIAATPVSFNSLFWKSKELKFSFDMFGKQ